MDKEKLKAKLEAVKQLKAQYYIGSQSAYHLIKENQESLDLEQRLKEEVSKRGISPNFCPSYLELDEVRECIKEVDGSINGDFLREYQKATGKYPSTRLLAQLFEKVFEPSRESFLVAYAVNKAKSESIFRQLGYIGTNKKSKLISFRQTLAIHYNDLFFRYSELFGRENIPEELILNEEKINEKVQDFLDGFYMGKLESDRLAIIGVKGTKSCDVLYDRLKREQILHRDEMQKTYLLRFMAEENIKDFDDFQIVTKIKTETRESDSEEGKEKRKYLRLISNRHKNWIKKFLSN